ncbi:pyrroline-5-carboxylate reductase [Rummeliibacillus suwonensis]|uniref:pyrroline-5-carboxylate reductase n=1 Tax=Rummeliibacillus suwonensis TaxID=1306154 RepID=UPI0011B5F2F6|nr:pyrroline-5-carboxylate reductase [Rummeliibacillus suwonensis]
MKYGFIGLGNMATAIIKGMVQNNHFTAADILGFNRSFDKTKNLVDTYQITGCTTLEEVMKADVIILAVQPQSFAELLPKVNEHLFPNQTVISIAAGKSINYLEANLSKATTIIRVMPNINAIVGASTTCFSASKNATNEAKEMVITLFQTIGSIVELPEEQFTIFSAIAGASPAFSYMYIDTLARAAVRAGMDKKQALQIASSAVLGSAKMVMESHEHPWELVDQVCSPGGTTIEGVTSLQNDQFESTIFDAVNAVIKKDHSLA